MPEREKSCEVCGVALTKRGQARFCSTKCSASRFKTRVATPSPNKYRGVHFKEGRYYAQIYGGGKGQRHLGSFGTPEEASAVYEAARRQREDAWGTLTPLTIKRDTAVVPLTRNAHALVDAADWPRVGRRRWSLVTKTERGAHLRYAEFAIKKGGRSAHVRMQNFILGLPAGSVVDHWNGDGLNNRRSNLRPTTHQQNMQNQRAQSRVRFKGICHSKRMRTRPYSASIRVRGTRFHLGYFPTPEEAAHAYDQAARKHFGEFACVNFPQGNERPARAKVKA